MLGMGVYDQFHILTRIVYQDLGMIDQLPWPLDQLNLMEHVRILHDKEQKTRKKRKVDQECKRHKWKSSLKKISNVPLETMQVSARRVNMKI